MQPKFPILLVDDDPLLSDILVQASMHCFPEALFTQVCSSADAIKYIKALDGYGPQLILLDFYLQDSGPGLDFLTFLRSHSETCFLPVVILTVSHVPANILKAYSLGASSFTVKPSDFNDWVTYLSSLRQYWFMTVSIPKLKFQKMI